MNHNLNRSADRPGYRSSCTTPEGAPKGPGDVPHTEGPQARPLLRRPVHGPTTGDRCVSEPRQRPDRPISPDRSASLESSATVVEKGYRICPDRCRRHACPRCGRGIGWKYRERIKLIIGAMRTFGPVRVRMWTLTVDPKQFATPEEAWEFVRDRRKLGELARAMGWRYYVWALEFHKDEGKAGDRWPHWHVAVVHRSNRIPFEPHARVQSRWGIGAVFYSGDAEKKLRQAPEAAAYYVTKYLLKPDPAGVPKWVRARTRVPMIHASQGFGPLKAVPAVDAAEEPDDTTDRRPERSIGAALDDCGDALTVLSEWREERAHLPRPHVTRKFAGGAGMPFRWFRRYVERVAPELIPKGKGSIFVPSHHPLGWRLRTVLALV
jgi:hypothetical protein